MTDDSVRGRFIWHELRTPNPAGARDFYSTALGWKTEGTEPDSSHSTFAASSGPLAGCAKQSPTAAPRWIPFVTVANVDDTLGEAVGLGADVVVEPTAIEDGGRYAVLTDPQGAAIGLYSTDDFGADRDPSPGEFSWHELATIDSRAALDFYTVLFGWELISEYDMGPMGVYRIFGYDQKQLGGIFDKDRAGVSGEPAWLSYVRVSDLSGTIEKAQAARGSLLTGPMEVPGGDWVAQLLDPHGAPFALHAVAADAKAEAAKAEAAKAETAKAEAARAETGKAEAAQAERAQAKRAKEEPAKEASPATPRESKARKVAASEASGASPQTAETTITEVWSATAAAGSTSQTTTASPKKTAKKKTARKKAPATKAEAARSTATKKKGSKAKKAGGKTAKKKAAAKKPTTKKAGSKTTAKKAAKKSAKKKTAKKKASKKIGKKAATKKTGKKAATKKAGGKSKSTNASASSRKKSGKKSSGRSAGSKKTGNKKAGRKASKKPRKKSGRR